MSVAEAFTEYRAGRYPRVGGSEDQDYVVLRAFQVMSAELGRLDAREIEERRKEIDRKRLHEEARGASPRRLPGR